MAGAARAKTAKSGSRSADRRLEVLRNAARIFADQGFRQATLEDVADALNMTRPALYYYASSKDELLRKCGEVATTQIENALDRAKAEPTGFAQFAAFTRDYLAVITDDPGRCFALTDMREIAEADREEHIRGRREITGRVQAMVTRGVDDGSIRSCDAALVVRMLFATLNAVPRWYRPGGRQSLADIADEILDLMGRGMRPG